jgi:hypothetical protein
VGDKIIEPHRPILQNIPQHHDQNKAIPLDVDQFCEYFVVEADSQPYLVWIGRVLWLDYFVTHLVA